LTTHSIPTREWPQADRLEKVVTTVEAISKGKSSYQAIARELGELDERQGRYYRRASEILGFTKRLQENFSTLTSLGRDFLLAEPARRNQLLTTQVLSRPVIRSVVAVLASATGKRTSRPNLESSLSTVAKTTKGMVHRRLTTVLSWLETLGVVSRKGQWVRLRSLPPEVGEIELPNDVPVIPKPSELKLFHEVSGRFKDASRVIRFEVDMAKRERASKTHERLRSLLAARIRHCDALPTSNQFIDIATHMGIEDFIIEVKTAGEDIHGQIRRGVSQLYEYRYIQALPEAKLVLLIEVPLSGKEAWLLDYLVKDRGIYIIWDASDDELFTTDEGKRELPFMKQDNSD